VSSNDIDIVRRMCEGGNGVFYDACLAICDENERLSDEVEQLTAENQADVAAYHDRLMGATAAYNGWFYLACQLAAALAVQDSTSFDEAAKLNLKNLALTAYSKARDNDD
jgi:hypothetical protein